MSDDMKSYNSSLQFVYQSQERKLAIKFEYKSEKACSPESMYEPGAYE